MMMLGPWGPWRGGLIINPTVTACNAWRKRGKLTEKWARFKSWNKFKTYWLRSLKIYSTILPSTKFFLPSIFLQLGNWKISIKRRHKKSIKACKSMRKFQFTLRGLSTVLLFFSGGQWWEKVFSSKALRGQ